MGGLGSPQVVLAYSIFFLVAVVGPGLAIHRIFKLPVDPALVLPLGFAFAAGTYWLSLWTAWGWLFPLLVVCADLILWGRGWTRADGPSLAGAVPCCLGLAAVLLVTTYPLNRLGRDGSFVVDGVGADDAAFHAGLTWELSLGYPPQIPGLAGFPLGYHLGQPLLRAAALRWARVHPYDSLSRFDNTVAALALVLLLRSAVRALGGGRWAESLVGWGLLATDASFLFAWNRGIDWWVGLTKSGTFLLSLFSGNSVLPSLALALGALVALKRFESDEGRGWLGVAFLLSLAVPFFKVFVAVQLVLGLVGAALLRWRRGKAAFLVALPALVATFLLAMGPAGRTMHVVADPLLVVRDARTDIGLEPLAGPGLALFALAWLAVALGIRILGLPFALRSLASRSAPQVALAIMAVSGWILGLLFRVSPLESGSRARPFNEALYFFEQSGLLLWIFTAVALVGLLKGLRGVLLATLCAGVALPSTVQCVKQKLETPPLRISPAAVKAMEALSRVSAPGDVVIEAPDTQRFPPPPLVLIGRRIPMTRFIPFLSQMVGREERLARFERVDLFFRTTEPGQARQIAAELGASYVCLFGRDEVAFPKTGFLEPVYESPAARVYRILR